MAKRRGNHEGYISKRSNGSWRAQVDISTERFSFTGKTRKEAQDWLREMSNQVDLGMKAKEAKMTLADFLSEWIITKKPVVTPHTWRTYSQLVRDYIGPSLGRTKIRDLSSHQIQRFYNSCVEAGVGLRTIQKTHTVLHASLNYAMKAGMIGRNPVKAAQPPKPIPKEMQFLNSKQAKRLLLTAKENKDPILALYHLAIVTGMREGELLALKWENVDLDLAILNVRFNLTRANGGGLQLKLPKTKASIRSIKLGNETLKILKEHRRLLEVAKDKSNGQRQDTGHIFTSSIGTAIDPSNLIKRFRRLLKQAGIPRIRFHDLRHTAASLMLNNGVDVLVASQRLGHAKPSITLDVYGHLMPAMQNRAADVMDKILSD
jgi:integrase